MNAFPILARRELLRYRGLFVAALAMGLFAALATTFSTAPAVSVEEGRGVAAVGLAVLWSLLVAVGLGPTALARRRGARPLGFDLRLPASPTAIWGARLAAAYVAALGAGVLVLAAAAPFGIDLAIASETFDLFANRATSSSLLLEGLLLMSPLLIAFVLLLAQVAEVAIAGERALAAVALVAALIAKGTVWCAAHQLLDVYAYPGIRRLVIGALALAVVVLVAASHRQLVRGRDDRRVALRAATPVLVVGALAITAGSLLYAHWYLNPSPAAVVGSPIPSPLLAPPESWRAASAPEFDPFASRSFELGFGWRATVGSAAGRDPRIRFTWLVHDRGRRARLIQRMPLFAGHSLQRAAAAPRIAWLVLARDAGGGTYSLHYLDLDRGEPEPKASEWSWKGAPAWRLAADGEAVEILVARDTWKSLPLPPR